MRHGTSWVQPPGDADVAAPEIATEPLAEVTPRSPGRGLIDGISGLYAPVGAAVICCQFRSLLASGAGNNGIGGAILRATCEAPPGSLGEPSLGCSPEAASRRICYVRWPARGPTSREVRNQALTWISPTHFTVGFFSPKSLG